MIRDEVRLKKKTLQKFRTQQAARLGLLLMSPPQFCRSQQDDNEDSPIYFQSVVAMETAKCLYSIQSALDPLMQDPTSSDPSATLDVFKIPPPSIEATDPRQVASELVQLIDTWKSTYSKNLSTVGTVYGPPSGITRYWVPAILTYVVGKYVVRYGFKRKEDIAHYINEFGKTAYDFAVNWIYEPVMKVWDTIRLKDQRLGVLSKEGLKSDLAVSELVINGDTGLIFKGCMFIVFGAYGDWIC
jgi:nuclear-control-of-ATPase protein 2